MPFEIFVQLSNVGSWKEEGPVNSQGGLDSPSWVILGSPELK